MGLARKLLNQSIKFDGKKKRDVSQIEGCLVAVTALDRIQVEYNGGTGRDTTQESVIMNVTEFIGFLREAEALRMIGLFGNGSRLLYNRIELLQEIAERGAAFFTNEDNRSFDDWLRENAGKYTPPNIAAIRRRDMEAKRDHFEQLDKEESGEKISKADNEPQLLKTTSPEDVSNSISGNNMGADPLNEPKIQLKPFTRKQKAGN